LGEFTPCCCVASADFQQNLKADNILVSKDGACKISGFGCATRTATSIMDSLMGTVFWMAPEVVKARKDGYTSKVDIWSLGCVALEMWSGRRPWEGEESHSVLFKALYACRSKE
jgi:serine/threonine protein kinase